MKKPSFHRGEGPGGPVPSTHEPERQMSTATVEKPVVKLEFPEMGSGSYCKEYNVYSSLRVVKLANSAKPRHRVGTLYTYQGGRCVFCSCLGCSSPVSFEFNKESRTFFDLQSQFSFEVPITY